MDKKNKRQMTRGVGADGADGADVFWTPLAYRAHAVREDSYIIIRPIRPEHTPAAMPLPIRNYVTFTL